MYILFGVIFAICILFFVINFFRRKHIIRKISCMDCCHKIELLNDLARPFSFSYLPCADVITSEIDAWQKKFGYSTLYDKSASRFNMVFDCEPVYFVYDNKTWLIEFWKGQYGINIGGEIGIYKADSAISPDQYSRTLFYGVKEDEMLPLSMEVNFKGKCLFSVNKKHWWLTGFCVGSYCEPEDITMKVCIDFPNEEMVACFVESLERIGYSECDVSISGFSVSFMFDIPYTWQPRRCQCLRVKWSQFKNRIFCRLYNCITRPFTCTVDQILYLYFYLPVVFRKLLRFKKCKKQKFRRKHK